MDSLADLKIPQRFTLTQTLAELPESPMRDWAQRRLLEMAEATERQVRIDASQAATRPEAFVAVWISPLRIRRGDSEWVIRYERFTAILCGESEESVVRQAIWHMQPYLRGGRDVPIDQLPVDYTEILWVRRDGAVIAAVAAFLEG